MNLTDYDPGAVGDWTWWGMLVLLGVMALVLGFLSSWLSWRNLHTRPVVWNYKKGWCPWWISRQG